MPAVINRTRPDDDIGLFELGKKHLHVILLAAGSRIYVPAAHVSIAGSYLHFSRVKDLHISSRFLHTFQKGVEDQGCVSLIHVRTTV